MSERVSPDELTAIGQEIFGGSGNRVRPFRKPAEAPAPASTETPREDVQPEHRTDLGLARRLVDLHGEDLRYVSEWGWTVWDGRRWAKDETLEVERRAKATVQELYSEAGRIQHDTERQTAARFALKSESRRAITNMISLARSEPEVVARATDFDGNPDLLTFNNGTLDLRGGELKAHSRQHLITKLVEHNYNPRASCPRFIAFLSEIMPDDAEMLKYLQAAFGYSLTGHTREKAVFVCHGVGDNGKSTLLSLWAKLLEGHAVVLQVETLMLGRWASSNSQADLADLKGARFAMTSETQEGQRLSEAKLKRITQGMGQIRAARKYENPISFPETHKLWIDCNHRPRIKDDGKAIWNRLHCIPFDVTIPKDRQDGELLQRLLTEAEGILGWAVAGARRWYRDGLQKPAKVQAATQDWRDENDSIAAFLEERCKLGDNLSVQKTPLYDGYQAWAEASGEFCESKRNFWKKIDHRGFDTFTNRQGSHFIGLTLKEQ